MDTTAPNPENRAPSSKTEEARQRRIAWEAEGIAKARASAATGGVVDEADVDAWIDSIGTDRELPVPQSIR